jgi:hypothetical protein
MSFDVDGIESEVHDLEQLYAGSLVGCQCPVFVAREMTGASPGLTLDTDNREATRLKARLQE